ncbi:MAG: hypothetical protein HYW81_01345 [Parcubacteria group bacterium]|nr:hypothetical protein [Parcubacteria group bacterium]
MCSRQEQKDDLKRFYLTYATCDALDYGGSFGGVDMHQMTVSARNEEEVRAAVSPHVLSGLRHIEELRLQPRTAC